jgi:multidrug efflux pump subunit AcrA (membrane-fusion protein)
LPQPLPAAVVPVAAEPNHPVSDNLTITGPLIVEHQLDVLAQREGVVAKLFSETGKRVRTGDLLAQLDDRQLATDLEAARAKTRSTDADLKNWKAEARVLEADASRAQKMWDAQLITREQWDHAKFKAEADEWDVQRVEQMLINSREVEHSFELELEKTRIRAPFLD